MVQRSRGIPAPQPSPRSRQTTDVTPRKITPMAPRTKKQTAPSATINGKLVLPKAKSVAPKAKGRIFKGTGKTIPALPSSSSKMGKMNRKAY